MMIFGVPDDRCEFVEPVILQDRNRTLEAG